MYSEGCTVYSAGCKVYGLGRIVWRVRSTIYGVQAIVVKTTLPGDSESPWHQTDVDTGHITENCHGVF